MDKRAESPNKIRRQATLGMKLKGWTPTFRVKKRVMPKAKIVDAENGVIQFSVSKKVEKGIYELVLTGNDGKELLLTKVEVI